MRNRHRSRVNAAPKPLAGAASRVSSATARIERWGTALFLLTLVYLSSHFSYLLFLVPGKGFDEVRRMEAAVIEQKQKNLRLENRNTGLKAEIVALKQDLSAIEEHARFKLGMINEDETFFAILKTPLDD